MFKIENKQHVAEIIMKPIAYTKCEIGQDWYKNEFRIQFVPSECYPDYIEVNAFIMEKIDGQTLNIEDAAKRIYDFLHQYDPAWLVVTDYIRGCKTHFDVEVTIE